MEEIVASIFIYIFKITVMVCMPIAIAGLLVGIIQTIFSVQDQSLSFVIKMVVIGIVLVLFGAYFFDMTINLFKLIIL